MGPSLLVVLKLVPLPPEPVLEVASSFPAELLVLSAAGAGWSELVLSPAGAGGGGLLPDGDGSSAGEGAGAGAELEEPSSMSSSSTKEPLVSGGGRGIGGVEAV